MCYKAYLSQRGVACKTNVLHVWFQFYSEMHTLDSMTSPHGVVSEPHKSRHPILKVPNVLSFTLILKQPLNSGHLATPYNGQFSRSQFYSNNT